MNSILKTISRTAFAVLALSVVMTACKKENSSPKALSVQNAKASVPSSSTVTVTGNYGNPAPGSAGFGTKYVNIITGAQDSVGLVAYNLLFTGTNNGNIGGASGVTFTYLVTTTALADISLDDFDASSAVPATFGRNTSTTSVPNGWWNYSTTTHLSSPVSNIVFFVQSGSSVYAFKPGTITGQGGATSNRALYNFTVGLVQ